MSVEYEKLQIGEDARMNGIVIKYEFSGDESAWRAAVETFLRSIGQDPALRGRFSYEANLCNDGVGRIHIGHWDNDETLAHLQAQPFFKQFAVAIQGFAGDTLTTTRFTRHLKTETAH